MLTVSPREYTVDEVLPYVTTERKVMRDFDGWCVKMDSLRYQVFLKSRVCVDCGLEGTVFRLERAEVGGPPGRAHFNLYGRNKDGDLILMTKDHIHPRSKGGKDTLDNLQTMCFPCNYAKSDQVLLRT